MAGSGEGMICDRRSWIRRWRGRSALKGGRQGFGATASERDSVNAREGRKGGGGEERGGGLAAAVTSSFMNSLYFCSVQINVRSC